MARKATRPTSRYTGQGTMSGQQATTTSGPVDGPHEASIDSELPCNVYGIDLGTVTYSVSHCLSTPGTSLNTNNIRRVMVDSKGITDHVGRVIAAWHKGHWIMGRNLELDMETVPSQQIIENFKLLLYDQHQDSQQALKVKRQLRVARKSERQLLTEFFRYIWHNARTYVHSQLLMGHDRADEYDNLVYMSVPALATFDATKKLKAAAAEAGLPRVKFVSEPLCAGACVLEEILSSPAHLIPDSTALILDCGGGTTDGALCKITNSPGPNLHQKIQILGQQEGICCGSTSIDESCKAWVIDHWPQDGAFDQTVRDMGLSRDAALHAVLAQFQDHKHYFPHPPAGGQKGIFVRGKRGLAREVKEVVLNYETKKSFFDPHIEEIVGLARRLVRKDTKACYIFLTGGLSSNIYFHNALQRSFPLIEVKRPSQDYKECPVARGVQLIEHLLDQTEVPSEYALGHIVDNETFNPTLHVDALNARGKQNHLVKEDFWDSEGQLEPIYVVEDRIMWLLTQNSKANAVGMFESGKHILQFHVPLKNPTLTLRVAFTKKFDIKDHEPLRLPKGDVKREFQEETMPIRLNEKILKRHCNGDQPRIAWLSPGMGRGRKPLPKEVYVEIMGRVILRHNNRSIEVGFEICDPEKLPWTPFEDISREMLAEVEKFDDTRWIAIWNTDTSVMKTSLPGPTEQSGQRRCSEELTNSISKSRATRATGYDADDELSRMLQYELEESTQAAHTDTVPGGRLKPTKRTNHMSGKHTSKGKRKIVEQEDDQPSKRQAIRLRQMAELAVNSRLMAGPSTCEYESPLGFELQGLAH